MTISKEIFGISRKENAHCANAEGAINVGFNSAIDLIDQFELSEEGILEALSTIPSTHEAISMIDGKLYYYMNKEHIAHIIKKNQSKIFVRNEIK